MGVDLTALSALCPSLLSCFVPFVLNDNLALKMFTCQRHTPVKVTLGNLTKHLAQHSVLQFLRHTLRRKTSFTLLFFEAWLTDVCFETPQCTPGVLLYTLHRLMDTVHTQKKHARTLTHTNSLFFFFFFFQVHTCKHTSKHSKTLRVTTFRIVISELQCTAQTP